MCNLPIEIIIVGIFLVIKGFPIILCFISVIWNVFLKKLMKSLFCFIVQVGIRTS